MTENTSEIFVFDEFVQVKAMHELVEEMMEEFSINKKVYPCKKENNNTYVRHWREKNRDAWNKYQREKAREKRQKLKDEKKLAA